MKEEILKWTEEGITIKWDKDKGHNRPDGFV
jgi:hypothetical protein